MPWNKDKRQSAFFLNGGSTNQITHTHKYFHTSTKLITNCKKGLFIFIVRRAILTSNIAIKRYCDKAILRQSNIFFDKILLLLFKISWNTHELRFSIHMEKKILPENVFLSFYRNIACKNCSSDESLRQVFKLKLYSLT